MLDPQHVKQRIPLLQYLQQRHWTARPAARRKEFVGLCPLHRDTRPSFYVNARKNLFYCHGCGQGGDLIRFVELSERLPFRQSLAFLQPTFTPHCRQMQLSMSATAFKAASASKNSNRKIQVRP